MIHFPQQRLTYKEKSKDNFSWARDVMNALLIDEAPDNSAVMHSNHEYRRKLSNYQLYNNQINQEEFADECNPLGLEVGQFKDSIKPYNKTYNKIQVLLGEELRRPFKYRPVLINSDGVKSKLVHRDALLRKFVYSKIQETIKSISNMYAPELLQEETEKLMDPQEVDRYMSTKYLEAREIMASKILQYFIKHAKIQDKKNDAFKHALISGDEIIWVGEVNNEPVVDVINPLGFFCHKSSETKFIEDSLYAGYRTYMTSGDILDKFGSYLEDEDLEKIDKRYGGMRMFGAYEPSSSMNYHLDDVDAALHNYGYSGLNEGSYSHSGGKDWCVQHVEWRSQKAVGFLTVTLPSGETDEEIVDENFDVPKHASKTIVTKEYGKKCTYYNWIDMQGTSYTLEWGWVPEVWSGVRIGHNIYCMIGPKKHQFRYEDNPFRVQLGYHGIIHNTMNSVSISMMDRMKPFQYLYFIVMHKLKKLIAHDRGKVFHIDTTMVDPSLGWEKTMYYLEEMDLDFFNPLQNAEKPGAYQRGKISGSTDRSNMQHILNYVSLLDALDQQISDVAGVNRQREGQAVRGEAVTNTQSNIEMSSLITEVYFNNHEKVWENVLSSLIQVAQSTWKNKSVVKQYALDDLSLATLELTPDSLINASFAVFVTNAAKEQEIFDKLTGLTQALIQNDKATFSDIIKTFRTNSIEELESEIIASEKKSLDSQRQQIQQQQQAEAQAQQAEHEFQLEYQKRELDNKILVEEIKSFAFQKDQDVDDNGIPDQFEIKKFETEVALQERKLDIEEKKIKVNAEQKEKDRKVKKAAPKN